MYRYVRCEWDELVKVIEVCNEVGDSVVAMTQNGSTYTLLIKLWGLTEDH